MEDFDKNKLIQGKHFLNHPIEKGVGQMKRKGSLFMGSQIQS